MADATNSYNARDFLRNSIAGDVNNGLSQPQTNATDSDFDLPPLPILVPPSTIDTFDFIVQEEKKLGLDFYQSYQNLSPEQRATTTHEHSLKLLNFALSHLKDESLELANNAFSLIILLSSNYFYNYLFALIRYNLEDYESAFALINTAYSQITDRQTLPPQLSDLAKQTHFVEYFYTLYLTLASKQQPQTQSKAILNYVIEHHLIQTPDLLLLLLLQFNDDKKTINLLAKEAITLISSLTNQESKNQLTSNLKTILTDIGEPN